MNFQTRLVCSKVGMRLTQRVIRLYPDQQQLCLRKSQGQRIWSFFFPTLYCCRICPACQFCGQHILQHSFPSQSPVLFLTFKAKEGAVDGRFCQVNTPQARHNRPCLHGRIHHLQLALQYKKKSTQIRPPIQLCKHFMLGYRVDQGLGFIRVS